MKRRNQKYPDAITVHHIPKIAKITWQVVKHVKLSIIEQQTNRTFKTKNHTTQAI